METTKVNSDTVSNHLVKGPQRETTKVRSDTVSNDLVNGPQRVTTKVNPKTISNHQFILNTSTKGDNTNKPDTVSNSSG